MSSSVPSQAWFALAWAMAGPPLIIYAALRVARGKIPLHAGLMIAAAVVTVGILVSFEFIAEPNPRRLALRALPLFKIHLAFAFVALAGIAWQLTSRTVPRLRALHRRTGPYVVLVWCLALVTGIYNFVFLYVMGSP